MQLFRAPSGLTLLLVLDLPSRAAALHASPLHVHPSLPRAAAAPTADQAPVQPTRQPKARVQRPARRPPSAINGDLRNRPPASSLALAVFGIGGALIGAVVGGFEGLLLGAAALWSVASLGDTVAARLKELSDQRRAEEEALQRVEWVERAEAAEAELKAVLDRSPACPRELRRAYGASLRAGVEVRAEQLMKRAAALIELLERPLQQQFSRLHDVDAWEEMGDVPSSAS